MAKIENKEFAKSIEKAIDLNQAEFIGEGEWVKDSAYRVYKYNGNFYALIIYDHQNKWMMEDSLQEIKEEEIQNYI